MNQVVELFPFIDSIFYLKAKASCRRPQNIKKCKNNIIKAYIIGKRSNFFKKAFKKKIKYTVSNTLKKAIENISKDINQEDNRIKNILFSPASASYDQFNNFEERGELFKNIIKKNAAKLF